MHELPITHFVGGASLPDLPFLPCRKTNKSSWHSDTPGMAFPVIKCFGVNLFVLQDRPVPVCLDGVAGLDSRSHTNAVTVATSPRACADDVHHL